MPTISISLSSFFLSACVGIFATFACIKMLKPAAIHIGLVDIPGGRKKHVDAVPLIGGIAVFLGFCFALLCFNTSLSDYRGLLAGSAILVLLGVMDDFKELTPRIRLLGQCLATLLLIEWGHIAVAHLGNLFFLGNLDLVSVWPVIVTIFFVLGFINATNMIDGHDGLAGLIVLGQALMLAFYNYQFHHAQNMFLLLIFVSVLSVFLFFNMPLPWRKRASVFLGDAGSTFAGFLIIWFAVDLSQLFLTQNPPMIGFNLVTVFWVLAYPLYDLCAVILHRACAKRSPFVADRDHLHYLLADLQFSPGKVTFLLFGLSVLLGLFGLFLANQHVREFWQLLIFAGVFSIYFLMSWYLRKH
ncbi:MAG: MraY family glycosyltransferase, partial [Gammaproteobacteria bacterium]|nr:MraY family glycosyltransferase [Gammaproteobacteria bacterium]